MSATHVRKRCSEPPASVYWRARARGSSGSVGWVALTALTPKPQKNARKAPVQRDWRPMFLDTLRVGGHVMQAAAAAGIKRQTAYAARQEG
jgi:hypothetical protein